MFNLLAGHFGLGATFLGVSCALLQQFAPASLVTCESEEIGEQFGEDSRVIDEIVQ